MHYRSVEMHPIRRLEQTHTDPAYAQTIAMLELCRESNDEEWRALMLLFLEDTELLDGAEGAQIRHEIRRKFSHAPPL